jgi:hypothetical protein
MRCPTVVAPFIGMMLVLFSTVATADTTVPTPLTGRIESLCHSWTESPCIVRLRASLRSERSRSPLVGKLLQFVAGGKAVCTATTDAAGWAACHGVAPSGKILAESGYEVVFPGDGRFAAGSGDFRNVGLSSR